MDWLGFTIVVLCLLVSAFFAASETALTGASRASMLRLSKQGNHDADALMALMAQDKKVTRGKLTFILLEAVGRAVIARDVEPAPVRDFLKEKLAQKV